MGKNYKKKKGPTSQHFVPKCYLSGFVDPNTTDGAERFSGKVVDNIGSLHMDVNQDDIVFEYNNIKSVEFFDNNKQK